jgi:hypothetical protein
LKLDVAPTDSLKLSHTELVVPGVKYIIFTNSFKDMFVVYQLFIKTKKPTEKWVLMYVESIHK